MPASPAVNDPGTAIDVVGRQTRLLTEWALGWEEASRTEPLFGHLRFPGLTFDDLHEDAFSLVARDGAAQVDVMVRLVKALSALTLVGPAEARAAAQHQLDVATSRAEAALTHPDDLRRLRAAAGPAPLTSCTTTHP